MKIVAIADEIYRELSEPTNLSVPPITYWLRSNIGNLNTHINSTYTWEETGHEFSPEIGHEEKYIIKKMYFVHYYDTLIRSNLAAASVDTVVELESDGSRIRKINKNAQAMAYISIRNSERNDLLTAIGAYKLKGASPMQVAGDDTVAGVHDPNRQYNRIKPSS
jgi:hypothetical protein